MALDPKDVELLKALVKEQITPAAKDENVFQKFLRSRKALVLAGMVSLILFGGQLGVEDDDKDYLIKLGMTYIAAQGAADFGKERKKEDQASA